MKKRIFALLLATVLLLAAMPMTTALAVNVSDYPLIDSNFNSYAVDDGIPWYPLEVETGGGDMLVQAVTTYHWNNGRGSTPGTIGIYEKVYFGSGELDYRYNTIGVWSATGRNGNTYWDAFPNVVLSAGHTYEFVSSDSETWSHNDQSYHQGFIEIRGLWPYTGSSTSTPSGISVSVNGSNVQWTDAAPFIDANDRTLVPLRAVADALGLTVSWNNAAREAVFTDGWKYIYFPIGSMYYHADPGEDSGDFGRMDTAAVIVNDRTYAPVRYLAEYFGYSVGWDNATRTVTLTGSTTPTPTPTPVPSVTPVSTGAADRIAVGGSHTVIVKEDGSLWATGYNLFGQIGDGTTRNVYGFKHIMDDVTAVDAADHTAAIKSDGSLWLWGRNLYGQLGIGTKGSNNNSATPVKVMDDVAAVSLGAEFTAALKTDGSLWTWGANGAGQLGNGTTEESLVPVKVMDDVVAVSAGGSHTMAIQSDGSLWGWGSGSNGQLGVSHYSYRSNPTPTKIMDDVAFVSAGSSFTLAVKKDGSLWGWGYNYLGQLGSGSGDDVTLPVKIMDGVSSACASYEYATAVKTDGTLWGWGRAVSGRLGIGTQEDSIVTPTRIMDGAAAIASGNMNSIAVKSDGTLWGWGRNNYGALGFGFDSGVDYVYAPRQLTDGML